MKTTTECLEEINQIKAEAKTQRDLILEQHQVRVSELKKSGAHMQKLRDERYECDRQIGHVDSARNRQLEKFELHELLRSTEFRVIPVKVSIKEYALFRVNSTDAFLVENRCVYRTTSYRLRVLGLNFSFVCGCGNCCHGLQREEVEKILSSVACVAVSSEIQNVVMRYCTNWPYQFAKSQGIELWEIESEIYDKVLDDLIEKLFALETPSDKV